MRHSIIHLTSALIVVALGMSSSTYAKSQLTVKSPQFYFGYAPQNSKLSHTYWLYSTGADTLEIQSVVPGCGCTKAPLERDHLASGDSTRLEIIFDTRMSTGDVGKGPRIESNTGRTDTVKFYATIIEKPDSLYPLTVKPYKLDISQFGTKLRDTMQFNISNHSDKPLELTLVDSPPDFFEVSLPKSVPANDTVHGMIKLKKLALKQGFEKSFTFELNDEAKTRFSVPVKRTVPDSSATPVTAGANASGH